MNELKARLDALRGSPKRKNLDARAIAALTANPGCQRRSVLDAAGIDKDVSVYALGITQPTGPDAEYYAAFEDLATVLSTFEQQVAKGNVVSAAPYEPATYRVVLSEIDPSQGAAIAWPWARCGS